jgi:hypothetical protein
MKTTITSTAEIIDEEEVNIWRIDKNNGTILININCLLDEGVSDCRWQDDEQKYLIAEYYDWTGNEVCAIIKNDGQIIKRDIRSIENYIDNYELFIITITGLQLDFDAIEYNLKNDEWNMAVIDRYGDFFIPPDYDNISYDEDENVFCIKDYKNGSEIKIPIEKK